MMSYIVSKTLEMNGKNSCGITRFTKLCTNFVEDWQETLGYFSSERQMGYEPFWYGMIAWTDMPIKINDEEDECKDEDEENFYENNFDSNKFYISNIKFMKDKQKLWDIQEQGENTYIKPKFKPEDLMKELRTGNKPIVIDRLDPMKAAQIDWISEIYSSFSTVELNILASHRSAIKSVKCIELICREWSRQFDSLLKEMEKNNFDQIRFQDIEYCANFCEQINCKLDFTINGIPRLLNRFEELKQDTTDSGRKAMLEQIYNLIKDNTPRHDDKRFRSYLSEFSDIYRYYRSSGCILTRNMLILLRDYYGKQQGLPRYGKSKIEDLIKKIPDENTPSIFDKLSYKEEKINCDISSLRVCHKRLKRDMKAFRFEHTDRPRMRHIFVGDGRDNFDRAG